MNKSNNRNGLSASQSGNPAITERNPDLSRLKSTPEIREIAFKGSELFVNIKALLRFLFRFVPRNNKNIVTNCIKTGNHTANRIFCVILADSTETSVRCGNYC